VAIGLDTSKAAASDDLADTIDYGSLATRVVSVVEGEPVNLIETLAERIANVCLADRRVEQVEVTVHKPSAPVAVPLDDVTVTIKRSRS
jgi:dihydroneopterin aldolase